MAHITNQEIDPDLRLIGRMVRPIIGHMSAGSFRRTQNFMNKTMKGRLAKDLNVTQQYVKRPDGSQLRMLVVMPKQPKPLATGVLWFHGGGYAIGVPEMDFGYARKIQAISNSVVVMPDYRLSVEAPFPAALDDGYLALKWLKANTTKLGVNPSQLFVAGDSAGGGLTAAVTLYARDQGEIKIAFQMPLYPMLDDRMTETSRDNDAPVWNTNNNQAAWQLYLNAKPGSDGVSQYAAPARAENYQNLPPTYTFIGTVEPFFAETKTYIKRLKAAGVPADIDIYPGGFHAFDLFGGKKPIGKAATEKWQKAFQYATEHDYSMPKM